MRDITKFFYFLIICGKHQDNDDIKTLLIEYYDDNIPVSDEFGNIDFQQLRIRRTVAQP